MNDRPTTGRPARTGILRRVRRVGEAPRGCTSPALRRSSYHPARDHGESQQQREQDRPRKILKNQTAILANQKQITANQKILLANQKKILAK